jgi:hypothetical protein
LSGLDSERYANDTRDRVGLFLDGVNETKSMWQKEKEECLLMD